MEAGARARRQTSHWQQVMTGDVLMRERYGAVHDWMQQSNWILLFRGMAIPPMPPHSKRAWLHGVRIDMALHLILNRSRMKPLAILTCVLMMAFMPAYGEGLSNMPSPQASFRGVFFNPQLGSNPVFSGSSSSNCIFPFAAVPGNPPGAAFPYCRRCFGCASVCYFSGRA